MAVLRVLSLLLVAMVVSTGASVGPSSNSSFCSESRECLQYQLLCKTDEYEVRHYSPTLWVSTDAEAYFMGVGAAMAFRRLFQYITGENEGGYQIDMTAPVLVKIPEETTMWEPAIYTLSFPLPQAFQQNPPQPTNDKLYFTEMLDMEVYVRSYGGWMLSVTSRLQAHQLTKELDRVGAKYNRTHHYGVGYDSPLKLLNRHNEVWYVSDGKPVCTDPQEPTPPHPPRTTSTEAPAAAATEPVPDTPPSSQPPRDSQQSPVQNPDPNPPEDLPIALALTAATTGPSEQSIQETSDVPEQSVQITLSQDTNASVPQQNVRNTPSPTAAESTQASSESSEETTQQSTPESSRQGTDSTQDVPDSDTEQSTQSSPSPVEQSTQDTPESSEQKTQGTLSLPTEKIIHETPLATEKSI